MNRTGAARKCYPQSSAYCVRQVFSAQFHSTQLGYLFKQGHLVYRSPNPSPFLQGTFTNCSGSYLSG